VNITLLYAPGPRTVIERSLELPEECTLGEALALSGWLDQYPETRELPTGIWNHKASRDTVLCEGDRVEVYRALRVDPKVARRERFVGQGARTAGLFAQRRPHSKAGY
jgi:putative ubiquitin-RnfH superfamily antitoxin RatB of RatAB toxin-antitoxin module